MRTQLAIIACCVALFGCTGNNDAQDSVMPNLPVLNTPQPMVDYSDFGADTSDTSDMSSPSPSPSPTISPSPTPSPSPSPMCDEYQMSPLGSFGQSC